MFRQNTKRMQNLRQQKIVVDNNVGGLKDVGINKKAARNSYTDVLNMVLSDEGGLKRRKTAFELGITSDSLNLRTYGLGFHKEFGYIRVRGDKIETLADENATWTEITNLYNVIGKDKVQFINFFATSETTFATQTITAESNKRYLTVNGMVANEYIGKLFKIGNEIKIIQSNTESIIYFSEVLEEDYASGTTITIHEQVPAVYIFSKGNDVKIWRGGATLQTIPFQIDKAVVQIYGGKGNNGRMFGIKNDDKIYISEVGTGEFAPKDNFFPLGLKGNLQNISIINNRAVIYSDYGRISLIGDNPGNFRIISNNSNKGCIAPGSIADGNNIEFFLSHEGIEFLNSIETSTVTEGISMSDSIRKKFEQHSDLTGAIGTISNGKYFLSIEDIVYIYDLEKSVKNHKPIFTIAKYTECSQETVTNAIANEWTCSENIDGKLFFGQGGKIYQITDEKIGPAVAQKKINYMLEFPPHFMGDLRLKKNVGKYRLFIHNDSDNINSTTRIKIYYKINDGDYSLVRQVDNIFEIECSINKKVSFGQIKVEFEDLNDTVDSQIQFHYSELEFIFFNKR